ncbi:25102_t:CDS:2, partial [Racocetra persica]
LGNCYDKEIYGFFELKKKQTSSYLTRKTSSINTNGKIVIWIPHLTEELVWNCWKKYFSTNKIEVYISIVRLFFKDEELDLWKP